MCTIVVQHSGPKPASDDLCRHACVQQEERDGRFSTVIMTNVSVPAGGHALTPLVTVSCLMGFYWEWWEPMWP